MGLIVTATVSVNRFPLRETLLGRANVDSFEYIPIPDLWHIIIGYLPLVSLSLESSPIKGGYDKTRTIFVWSSNEIKANQWNNGKESDRTCVSLCNGACILIDDTDDTPRPNPNHRRLLVVNTLISTVNRK